MYNYVPMTIVLYQSSLGKKRPTSTENKLKNIFAFIFWFYT